MRRALFVLVFLALPMAFGAGRNKQVKPPDLQLLSVTARRSEASVKLDGRIRNSGQKPLQGLILVFDFLAPGEAVITTQKGPIDEEVLAPGQESVFRFECNDPVRAVEYRISAVDEEGREFRLDRAGPFIIE